MGTTSDHALMVRCEFIVIGSSRVSAHTRSLFGILRP